MEYLTANTNPLTRRGVTLMESLIATVVLAVAVVGVSGTLIASTKQSSDVDDALVVKSMASELMEEVAAKPFSAPSSNDQPGWSARNKDRSKYDDVADFNGYADLSPFTSLAGKSIDPGTGFSYKRSVTLSYVAAPVSSTSSSTSSGASLEINVSLGSQSSLPALTSGDFAIIKVSVDSSSGQSVTLTRLICNSVITK